MKETNASEGAIQKYKKDKDQSLFDHKNLLEELSVTVSEECLSFLLYLGSLDCRVAAANDLLLMAANDSDWEKVLILDCVSNFPQTEEDIIPPLDMYMSGDLSERNWLKHIFSVIKDGRAE